MGNTFVMKYILTLLTLAIMVATSCKKSDSTAARPSTPLIKGKWVYIGWTGGFSGVTTLQPATVYSTMHLKPDFTFISTYGTTTTTGVSSLSGSGSATQITFILPSSGGSGYPYGPSSSTSNYVFYSDTLVLWQSGVADGIASYYKKY